jgi:hypothetical protein
MDNPVYFIPSLTKGWLTPLNLGYVKTDLKDFVATRTVVPRHRAATASGTFIPATQFNPSQMPFHM